MTEDRRRYVSEADIAVADPRALMKALADYWASLDVEIELFASRLSARLGAGEGTLETLAGGFRARLEAADLGALEMLRSYLTDSLEAFAGADGAQIVWRGNMRDASTLADFREVRLVSNVQIAPRMRRLTFTGEDVARFGSEADIHVRMYFPPEGPEAPEWPRPGPDGRIVWPPEERRPDVRYYTVRRFDADRSEIEIDFVMHDDEGPGSAFAARARPGAIVGMAGPLGRAAPKAQWMLLAGDETALPAIARILESLPADAEGVALIEIDREGDELDLAAPPGVAVRWLHRTGAPAGSTDLIARAVRSVAIPDRESVFVWVACEYSASKAIRKHLRTACGLARERHLVVGYWQRERADAEAA